MIILVPYSMYIYVLVHFNLLFRKVVLPKKYIFLIWSPNQVKIYIFVTFCNVI